MVNVFKEAFDLYGADKAVHGYHELYNTFIEKEEVKSLLEIGALRGNSLKAFAAIWPNIQIDSMDVEIFDEQLAKDFNIFKQSSTDEEAASKIGEYDFIIDDGDHHWRKQFETFKLYYPKAKKYYMIEDIQGQYSLDRLIFNINKGVLQKAQLFTCKGPKRVFTHSEHVKEDNYFGLLIIK